MQPLELLKKEKVFQYFLIIILIGVVLITMGDILDLGSDSTPVPRDYVQTTPEMEVVGQGKDEFELSLERDLTNILSHVQGVGKVVVDVSLETGFVQDYLFNQDISKRKTEERDSQGGTRVIEDTSEAKEVAVLSTNGNEEALVKEKDFPTVRGVVVVAQGAENIKVKRDLIYAVRTLLDIPIYRITVLPYQER